MATTSSGDDKILIIGAGVSGLLLAQGLKLANIPFMIFERDDSISQRNIEWTMAIHWATSSLGKFLSPDMLARFNTTYCDPLHPYSEAEDITPLYNRLTSKPIALIPTKGMIRVSRGRMREFLTEGIEVQLGKCLTEIVYEKERGVIAYFADGTQHKGRTVIGADGPRSTVRYLLLGEQAKERRSGIWMIGGLAKFDDSVARGLREMNPVVTLGFHPDGFCAIIATQEIVDRNDPTSWVFQIFASFNDSEYKKMDDTSRLAKLRGLGGIMAGVFGKAYETLPEMKTWGGHLHCWVTIPWDNHEGRVTLLGDAAHPLPPFRGQGINHGIMDADHLLSAFSKVQNGQSDLAIVIGEYEAEMIPRGAEEVRSSVANALMVHDWQQIIDSPLVKRGSAFIR